ncbi:hypothetical protein [Roseovarius spongiae]|uniref:hypothetical protein n=1 Tax=Roseovarius spongiae TaxID=2320272 RepID=UPI001FE4FAF9|nr:hypothetical protein [Roseovarius spongiae]
MKRAGLFATIIMFGAATLVYAERNLIPTLENQTDVCPEQPAEPVWMQDIDVRNSYKRLLVQQIYRAQSMQRIIAAKTVPAPSATLHGRRRRPSSSIATAPLNTGTWSRQPRTTDVLPTNFA